MNQYKARKQAVKDVFRQYVKGKVHNPYEAAQMVHEAIGGLTRVEFDRNKKFKVYNHDVDVSLPRKAKAGKLEQFVLSLLHIAENQEGFDQNNISKVCFERKDGRVISTKHHQQDLRAYQQRVIEQYAA